MMSDEAGQVEMWKKTGGPPPNVKLWPKLAADDKDFAALKHAVFDQKPITHSAYYFAEWPAVHKAYSDAVIAAMSGKREDIAKVLAEGSAEDPARGNRKLAPGCQTGNCTEPVGTRRAGSTMLPAFLLQIASSRHLSQDLSDARCMNEKTRFMLLLIAPAALVLVCFQVVPIIDRHQCQLPRLVAARSATRPGSASRTTPTS